MFEEYDYDEVPYEPSVADEILAGASAKLMDAIKKNVADRIREIEQQNERLARENKILHKEVTAVNQEKRELQAQREELERRVKRMPIGEFLGQRAVLMYSVGWNFITGPKCDKCNDDRYRPYTTPLGKNAKEKCVCLVSKRVYAPKEHQLSAVGRTRKHELYMRFKRYDSDSDSWSSSCLIKSESVYGGADFATLDRHKVYFLDESQCQEYCEWLNSQDLR